MWIPVFSTGLRQPLWVFWPPHQGVVTHRSRTAYTLMASHCLWKPSRLDWGCGSVVQYSPSRNRSPRLDPCTHNQQILFPLKNLSGLPIFLLVTSHWSATVLPGTSIHLYVCSCHSSPRALVSLRVETEPNFCTYILCIHTHTHQHTYLHMHIYLCRY